MSLINQVLRELDERHAAPAVDGAVRVAPRATAEPLPHRRALAVAAALLGLAAGAVFLVGSPARSASVAPSAGAGVMASASVNASPAAAPVPKTDSLDEQPSAATATTSSAWTAEKTALAGRTATNTPSLPSSVKRSAEKSATPPAVALPAVAPPAAPASAPHAPAEPATASRSTAPLAASTALARIEKRPALRTARERAEAAYQRGVAAHQHGQWADADAAYAAALREDAGFALARQALAGVRVAQGRADEARALLDDGLTAAPRHAGMAMMQARLLAERGELPRAAEVLERAAIASPSPEDSAFHAAILQRLDRHADATVLFASALRVVPSNGVWWMGLGLSLAADGRRDEAREAFQRARASGSLSPELAQYVEQRLRQLL